MKKMESLFLIGGSGFIGKNLAMKLSGSYKITVFDKYIDADFFRKYPSIDTVQLDLANEFIPAKIPTPSYIINLASIVTAERDLSLFDDLISSNLRILLNLYERFKDRRELKLFIQFGSSEEYGSDHSPFVETMRENPNSPYSLIKQLTTNTAIMLYHNYGFPTMVIRPGNLFGLFQSKTKFIPYIIEQLKNNAPLNVSPSEQKRDFINAEYFSHLIGELIKNNERCCGEIVNVSSGESISLKEIIEFCKEETSSSSVINYGALPYRENEIMDLRCSINKLSAIIGQNVELDIKDQLTTYIKNHS